MNRIESIAQKAFAPELVQRSLESLSESSARAADSLVAGSESFLADLGKLLVVSPPMLDTLRAHPEYIGWLYSLTTQFDGVPKSAFGFQERWISWNEGDEKRTDVFERLRAFKRREYLFLSFLDIAGLISFDETVRWISALADWVINEALRCCWEKLAEEESARWGSAWPAGGFAVIAMGKLGGEELNYSSDVDLIFCRRNPESSKEHDLFSKLGERLVRVLSRVGPEGFLYRVDMRLRPHGSTGPLVPTIDSIINYYESWGEPWERQALIKARYIAGGEDIGNRFQSFVRAYTFSRQMDESALEDIKRVKHRSEKEYAIEPKIHLKQGPGGIRDIEFYVQFSQLTIGWRYPEVRLHNTLRAIEALAHAKVLLEGEESILSIAYVFLRTVEHRLQLRALTPQSVIPDPPEEVDLLARSMEFKSEAGAAADAFLENLNRYRSQVRGILERVYLAPGYLRLNEREEELAQLLSDRIPKQRVREILSQYGFRDIDKAWQNIRLIALGPAGLLLPPGERRAFLEFAFPMLEVLRDTIDPDQALHNLEDFAAATGNRISFLRTLASRRPHLSRLTNLLAISNRCRQILSRHPEYFDSLARGIYLHEGRREDEMYSELQDRMGASPRGEPRENVLRRFRQREVVRIAYRDLAGLADSLEISMELSGLASACLQAAVDWTRPPYTDPSQERIEPLRLVVLGKLGSRQMHYASDLDLIILYDVEPGGTPELRARFQKEQDERVEKIIELLASVTPEGTAYPIDLRLRPGGASGILARSWESFVEYAAQSMQPWERMALVRSRMLSDSTEHQDRWTNMLASVVYEFEWTEEALESIRHIKRRIESEKSKGSRNNLDFKYGKGGIADLEFLVKFLQIKYGRHHSGVQTPGLKCAVLALHKAGVLKDQEKDVLLQAHQFERQVENRFQLMEEWTSREISRESPSLSRLAASIGYRGDATAVRKAFVSDWEDIAGSVRRLVEKHFY
jgi:[glutamine synthetase] adenylyltransferase / [glutamine synthetase]-adenylyl-L-tyrosine phosphorylase